jgi:uncharacterized protein DUF6788
MAVKSDAEHGDVQGGTAAINQGLEHLLHAKGCAKCASGEGHPLAVLTVSYPGGRTRQFSLRRERVAEVRRWLRNHRKPNEALEAICELNHELLRPDEASSQRRSRHRD